MGCDIHAWIEERRDTREGKDWWVARADLFIWRDYLMFGALAGVRVEDIEHIEPRGLPDNLDWGIKEEVAKWEDDGHSWSWLNAAEVKQAFDRLTAYLVNSPYRNENQGQFAAIVAFMQCIAGNDPTRCRLTFWFDN